MASWKLSKIKFGFLETASSGGTLTLVASSKQYQIITGSSSHSVQLPDATTMTNGLAFVVVNLSTGSVAVKNNSGTTLSTLASGATAEFLLSDNSSANGVWRSYAAAGGSSAGPGAGSTGPGAAKTSNYTVVTGDNGSVINVNTASGPVVITLPSPAAHFSVTIKDSSGAANLDNYIRIARSGSAKIDGEANDDIIDKAYLAVTYVSNGTDWFRASSHNDISAIGMIMGGLVSGTGINVMEYVSITTLGNAVDFGDLTQSRGASGGLASSVTAICGGGGTTSGGTQVNTIDYVAIAAKSNATDFGDLTLARDYTAGASSDTRGIFAGGYNLAAYPNVIDYITIATTGNATDFGDLTTGNQTSTNSGLSSTVRAVYATSGSGGNHNDYVTIATTGNATSFGNLSVGRGNLAACAGSTRGLFGGGNTGVAHNIIDYITIATTGNATDFGDLTVARAGICGFASKLRGLFAAGTDFTFTYNVIDYVTIATLGNAVDFGDLSGTRDYPASCSSAHGGLA